MEKNGRFRLVIAVLCLAVIGYAFTVFAAGTENAYQENEAGRALFPDGEFRITTGGSFVLSGEHEGRVFIEAGENDVVELVLNGADLHNPDGPAIFAYRAQRVELVLADGTVNSVSDGRRPGGGAEAAVYAGNDLAVSGSGTLNVGGNRLHGIRAGGFLAVNGGTINATAQGDAIGGRGGVAVAGGSFTLAAGGNGIRSDAGVTISGGDITITATGNGINADGPVLITGGTINVVDSYEGIEGMNVTVTGGDISIFARDDGINISDFNEPPGGTRGAFGINPEMFLRISGGNLRVHGLSDGIDSNGNIFMEGGRLLVSGPSGGGRDAIDLDGDFVVTGGELVAVGGIRRVSPSSTQPVLIASLGRRFASGSVVELKDPAGRTVLEHAGETAFNMAGFTSPAFELGSSFYIYVNGTRTSSVVINGIVTNAGPGGNRR